LFGPLRPEFLWRAVPDSRDFFGKEDPRRGSTPKPAIIDKEKVLPVILRTDIAKDGSR